MPSLRVMFTHISAERVSETTPAGIQFQTQLSVPSGDLLLNERVLKVPFVFNMTSTPPIISLTLKGYVVLEGEEKELRNIYEEIKKKRAPQYIVMATLHNSMVEAILLSREVGVPPPLPLPKIDALKPKVGRDYTLKTI